MRRSSIGKLTSLAYDRIMTDMHVHAAVVLAAVIENTTPAERRRLAATLDANRNSQDYSCFAEIGEIARAAGAGAAFDEAMRLSQLADRLAG